MATLRILLMHNLGIVNSNLRYFQVKVGDKYYFGGVQSILKLERKQLQIVTDNDNDSRVKMNQTLNEASLEEILNDKYTQKLNIYLQV